MPKVIRYSELTPDEKNEYEQQSPEQRKALETRLGVQFVDDRPQEFAPNLGKELAPKGGKVSIDFGGIGDDLAAAAKAIPRTAAGAMSGALGMSRVPGIGQTPMGLGAGALMGAVGGAFGPEIDTPEGVGSNLINAFLPGAQARMALPNNVIGNFLSNLLASKTGQATDTALRTLWSGKKPEPVTADSFLPSAGEATMAGGMALVPPLFQRLIGAANTPEKQNLLAQFRQHFQDLDIPAAQRKAAMEEIDRRLNQHSIDRLDEGQRRMVAARVQNEPILGPRDPVVSPEVEAAMPPSDLGSLLSQSVQQAQTAKAAGQKPQFQGAQVPAEPPPPEQPEETIMQVYNRARKLFGMDPVPEAPASASVAPEPTPQAEPSAPAVEPVYSNDTNAFLRKMKLNGPTDFVRGAFANPSNMERLPQMLDAAEEAGMPEIRTIARGHFIDNMLNASQAENPQEVLQRFQAFGKQKFGERTGADILNDVAGSSEAYNNMDKLYASLEKSPTGEGPLKLFWKQNKSAATAGALGSLIIVQKLTGMHLPIVSTVETIGAATAGAAAAGSGAYRVLEVSADNLGKLIGRKRSAMWDAILNGVEGAGRMTPAAMNSYLGELRRNAAESRVVTEQELKKLDPAFQ